MKRMRLPNGFGQISKLSKKNLRNPWRAMVTVGWNESGKPIRQTVGYYSSYEEYMVSIHFTPPKVKIVYFSAF